MGTTPTKESGVQETYSIISFIGSEVPKEYKNLILSKWMRSLRFGNDFLKLTDSENYYGYYSRFIEYILKGTHTKVKLAVLTADLDVVLGFAITEEKTLHYVWVHKDIRKQGIGFSLLPKEIETITHLTKFGLRLWPKLIPWARFKPFI